MRRQKAQKKGTALAAPFPKADSHYHQDE
jgi:hypothetical protein